MLAQILFVPLDSAHTYLLGTGGRFQLSLHASCLAKLSSSADAFLAVVSLAHAGNHLMESADWLIAHELFMVELSFCNNWL